MLEKKRIFVLGVGAQKSGTSWLHSYISQDLRANMGFAKEYHIWDAIHSSLCERFKIAEGEASKIGPHQTLRYHMQNRPGFYEGYFRQIFDDGAEITGDITPSYSLLTEQQFAHLRTKIKDTGADIRVVFLMRDPFERCWSAARMEVRRSLNEYDEENFLAENYASDDFRCRTRYEVVCGNLRAAFEEEELYFGFYETMFEDANLLKLSNFLGVSPKLALRSEYVNASPKEKVVSPKLRDEIRKFYASTYHYCLSRFPEIEDVWGE